MTTNINQGIKTVLYSAADINRAKALFTKLLGVEPSVDSPYYVGFKVGDQDIGITPNTPPGPTAFWLARQRYQEQPSVSRRRRRADTAGAERCRRRKVGGNG
jgi:catechol 2,3-dioxygenase-like lactoylglutathione lyase family enzyme